MSKRGVMPLHVLVVILILLITGLSLGYFIVLLRQTAENTDVSFAIGQLPEEVPGGVAVVAPDEVHKAFDKFVALGDYTGPCLTEFKWSDLSDFQIEMQIDDAGTLFLLRNKDGQLVKNRYAAGKKMCVVGGTLRDVEVKTWEPETQRAFGSATDYFQLTVIDKDGKAKRPLGTEPTLVSGSKPNPTPYEEQYGLNKDNVNIAAQLFYINWIKTPVTTTDDISFARQNKKRLFIPDFTVPEKIVVNPKAKKMNVRWADDKQPNGDLGKEDGDLMYIPESGRVCMFGTFGGGNTCYADARGLDNDCLLSEQGDFFEEHNLPYLIRNKKVPTCS